MALTDQEAEASQREEPETQIGQNDGSDTSDEDEASGEKGAVAEDQQPSDDERSEVQDQVAAGAKAQRV